MIEDVRSHNGIVTKLDGRLNDLANATKPDVRESDDGAMKTGWVYDKNYKKWYYLNESGVMQAGWVEVEGNWYYLDNTQAMQTGWIKDNGEDYCLYSDGSMIHDCTAYGYSFDSSGVATKIG